MFKGKFITFEGPDGSGKTTVSTAVVEALKELGYPVRYTREPGGSVIAEKIRTIILDPAHTEMDARCEALLYAAARAQHLNDIVLPALEQGIHVICDRFTDSSIAYQGFARGLGAECVRLINQFATSGFMPEKTIYLDLPAEIGLQRMHTRDRANDRLDNEDIAFHTAVCRGYEQVKKEAGDRMVVIDASAPEQTVIEEAIRKVREILDAG